MQYRPLTLSLAAEWHTSDVLNNRDLDGDIGSDGSTPQSRAEAAGYRGEVTETVAKIQRWRSAVLS